MSKIQLSKESVFFFYLANTILTVIYLVETETQPSTSLYARYEKTKLIFSLMISRLLQLRLRLF